MTETTRPLGRRERKKAATRQAIADAALRLFLAHGYDQVSIKDICEAADVSTTTLFKHFPGKEALVFDQDADREAALTTAVTERPAGQSITAALRAHMLDRIRVGSAPEFVAFKRLVETTPALRDYQQRMWMRHESALARVVAEDIGARRDDPSCAALARFALLTVTLADGAADPYRAVDTAFDLLEHGWQRLVDAGRDRA